MGSIRIVALLARTSDARLHTWLSSELASEASSPLLDVSEQQPTPQKVRTRAEKAATVTAAVKWMNDIAHRCSVVRTPPNVNRCTREKRGGGQKLKAILSRTIFTLKYIMSTPSKYTYGQHMTFYLVQVPWKSVEKIMSFVEVVSMAVLKLLYYLMHRLRFICLDIFNTTFFYYKKSTFLYNIFRQASRWTAPLAVLAPMLLSF